MEDIRITIYRTLSNMPRKFLAMVWNNYCEQASKTDCEIWEFDGYTFDTMNYGVNPYDILMSIDFDNFNIKHPFFGQDGNGHWITKTDPRLFPQWDMPRMVDYIVTNGDCLGSTPIKERLTDADPRTILKFLTSCPNDAINAIYNDGVDLDQYNGYREKVRPMSEFDKIWSETDTPSDIVNSLSCEFTTCDKYIWVDTANDVVYSFSDWDREDTSETYRGQPVSLDSIARYLFENDYTMEMLIDIVKTRLKK